MTTFAPTPRTTPHRKRERVSYERATAHAILDEALYCHFGFVADGTMLVLPTVHARVGDTLYLHGSTGSGVMLAARGEGLSVCVTATHLDGLVLARSWTHHSVNYRSVVVHGRAHVVTNEQEKWDALAALVDRVGAGRSTDSRPPTTKELAETAVLAITLREASVKARVGGVMDDAEDLARPHWAGVIPLRLTPGLPEPDAGMSVPLPAYLRPDRGPWLDAPTLEGAHVELSALDMSHVDGLLTGLADAEVWRYLLRPMPANRDEMAGWVAEALRMWQRGERVPFVLRCARSGQVTGTTSYHDLDEANRSIAIGYTALAADRWRTGVNTEAKLLLLRRAFDVLGATRVEWHTDIRNERSQRAIERLGARREGVMRRHKQRPDGTWRDTVLYAMTDEQWPTAQARLENRLSQRAPVA